METGYKGREVIANAPSQCYFNLHTHKFSMKQKGLVVLHSDTIYLKDVTFSVSEAGRQRVLQEKRKNVHAYVKGEYLLSAVGEITEDRLTKISKFMKEAYYNPYKTSSFIDKETGEELKAARLVMLINKRIFYLG